jgi:murein L,D-transpeptidase YafK
MTPRQTHLALAALAVAALAGGFVALRYMPDSESQSPARSNLLRASWSGALATGLRMAVRMQPGAFPPAPPPAAAPSAEAALQALPQIAALPPSIGGVEGSISFPPAAPTPAPPERATPLPPSRPADLADLASRFAETAATAEQPQPAPPARPQEATSALTTQAESAQPTQVARAVEPTLRPAPDDAFQQEAPIRFGMGDQVFVRIFKQEGQLELWLRKTNSRFSLYKTFPICKWSGRLGPKIKEADYQSPEGFYSVSAKQLHPNSNYHRAFNVGYPNAFDRQNGRTGGLVMVHGACKSVGCFAMTDRGIEEIYAFVEAALRAGQREVQVHIFPFRMTEQTIARETGASWLAYVGVHGSYEHWSVFWRNLKEGYDLFEQTGEPPVAFACGDHYAFGAGDDSCRRIAGW